MRIIRKRLDASDLYPANMRYNPDTGEVEITPDGGDTWLPAPDADPRTNNPYPAIATENPRCDAAARMSALLQEMEASYEASLQAGAGAAEATTALLLVLAFINWIAVLVSIIVGLYLQLVTLTYADVHNAFASFDWDDLTCKIFAVLDENGVMDAAGLAALRTALAGYSDTQETVLVGSLDILGYGGLNAAASTRTETGDCATCAPTGWEWDFTLGDQTGWGIFLTYGTWDGSGFIQRVQGNGDSWCKIACSQFSNKIISHIEAEVYADAAHILTTYTACPGEVLYGNDAGGNANQWQVLGAGGNANTCGVRVVCALAGVHYIKIRRVRVFCTSLTGFVGGHPYYLPPGVLRG